MKIQPFEITDYEEVYALWSSLEGIGLSSSDSREKVEIYLQRNPNSSFVCRRKGEIVGTALAGHDGRRGYIHHLAVRSDLQGKGIGSALLNASLEQLREIGIDKCHVFVFGENEKGRQFWTKSSWTEREELVLFSRNL